MAKYLLILFVSISAFVSDAQVIDPKHTFNIELGLPNGMTNKSFKSIMQGLVNVAPYYQYKINKQIVVGIGVRYSYFAINEFKVSDPTYGGMHSGGIFFKTGWEKFHTDHFATEIGLKFGYTQNYFVSDRNDSLGVNPRIVNSTYLEPSIGLILTADEQSSYRLVVSYAFQGFGFRPDLIGLQSLGGYDPSEFNKVTSFLIVGFGYTYYFKSKK
jgi:hypothetical protein